MEVSVGNRTYQVLITIWSLTSVQVKSRGFNNDPLLRSHCPQWLVVKSIVSATGILSAGVIYAGAITFSCPWFKSAIVVAVLGGPRLNRPHGKVPRP